MDISAFNDPKFPTLRQAANTTTMLAAFRDYFAQQYPARVNQLTACFIDQIRYKPGNYCRFLYRLRLQNGGEPVDQWFVGEMHRVGDAPRQNKAQNQPSRKSAWVPYDYWAEMNMTLSTFPHDARLPHVVQLVDPAFVQQVAQEQVAAFGLTAVWQCRHVVVHQVKYMPRKRVVLRYDFTWQGLDGEQKPMSVYSKTYSGGESEAVYAALDQVWAEAQEDSLLVPQPICHLAEYGTIWQAAWPGVSLIDAILAGDGERYLPHIAASLASLHLRHFDLAHLRTLPTLTAVLENAQGDEADINDFFGHPILALREIVAGLEAEMPLLNQALIPQTAVHGTFKIGQILVDGDRVAVVDFDDVAVGDPLYDLAEFLASILVLHSKHGVATEQVIRSVDTFLHAYAARVPWACDLARIRWYTTAFMLARIHSLLKGQKMLTQAEFEEGVAAIQSYLPFVLGEHVA